MLIRNGEAIQTARELDTVVFDKTGTLTYGRPEVRASCGIDGAAATGDAVAITLAIEKESEHPLARALTSYLADLTVAPSTDTPTPTPTDTRAHAHRRGTRRRPRLGPPPAPAPFPATASLRSSTAMETTPVRVAVGSVRWLRETGAHPDAAQEETIRAWRADGMTIVGTAVIPAGADADAA